MGNPYLEIFQDCIIGALEHEDCHLPQSFTVFIEDEAFVDMLKHGLIYLDTKKKIPWTVKKITYQVCGYNMTVRSDEDPDWWLAVNFEETVH